MNTYERKMFAFIITLLMVLIYVLLVKIDDQSTKINKLKSSLITLGYAEYNRTNGNWQFIENK
jgi:hypothetical protein